MFSLVLLVVCVMTLLAAVTITIVIFVMMQGEQRDTVSTAREDWIHRRSDKDEQGW